MVEIYRIIYPKEMNHDHLPSRVGITLITGSRSYTHRRMHELIIELALINPVRVLIGGNHYDHYGVNYALAMVAPRYYEQILDKHIRLSRAETCYQMVELLSQTHADVVPSLVLDLLTPFYDESIPDSEINQLLFEAILALQRLSQSAAIVVSSHAGQNRPRLLKVLENALDRVEYPQVTPPQPVLQPALIR
jgi:hypothetical protein